MSLRMRQLGHRFGDGPWLFQDLTMTLYPGRVYALTGPSGSGKSTLLGLLAGWEAPAKGVVERNPEATVSWVFQNPHGTPARKAIAHVALPLMASGDRPLRAHARARIILRRFRLEHTENRRFRELSGGEAQRLMLARAFAASPTLLLVDEPTAQLDPSTAGEVNRALSQLATDGVVVVVATHDPRTRDACTDHIDLRRFSDPPSLVAGPGLDPR